METIIIAGLVMAGVFTTAEKIGLYSWFYDYYLPRRPLSWLPGQICEHCLSFWAGFFYCLHAGVLGAIISGLAISSVSYLIRK